MGETSTSLAQDEAKELENNNSNNQTKVEIENPEEITFIDEPSTNYRLFAFLWEIIKIVLIALAIIIPVRYLLVQPFYVNGASMETTFQNGNYVMINEFNYRFTSDPQRGDVIVFRYPLNLREFFIKRIIALPNETVEIKDNKVIIYNKEHPSGFALDESDYLASTVITRSITPRQLDDNEYFVLGDNRPNSSDSRDWGFVNRSHISGKVFFRAWPFDKVGTFDDPEYNI